MKLNITTEEIELTKDIEDLIDQKISKGLDKYLSSLDIDNREADLLLAKGVRWGFTIKFDMELPGGKHVHINEKRKELPATITAVSTSAKRALRKYKEKHQEAA